MLDDQQLEHEIEGLLADSQLEGQPLREALARLFARYREQLTDLERLTSISDGYQTVLRDRNESLAERYRKQIRQLQKIVRISDHYQQMLHELNESLKVASMQDPLTGLPNRRLMLDRLTAEAASARRRGSTFSLALVDIDNFKKINDTFGHDVGDTAIVGIARALIESLRAYDVSARWGGEEFLLLLPDTGGAEALDVTERLRKSFEELEPCKELPAVRTTVSIGVAEHVGGDVLDTIKRADRALYEAKRAGRNRVELAATSEPASTSFAPPA